jgi:hypothetical protein
MPSARTGGADWLPGVAWAGGFGFFAWVVGVGGVGAERWVLPNPPYAAEFVK